MKLTIKRKAKILFFCFSIIKFFLMNYNNVVFFHSPACFWWMMISFDLNWNISIFFFLFFLQSIILNPSERYDSINDKLFNWLIEWYSRTTIITSFIKLMIESQIRNYTTRICVTRIRYNFSFCKIITFRNFIQFWL